MPFVDSLRLCCIGHSLLVRVVALLCLCLLALNCEEIVTFCEGCVYALSQLWPPAPGCPWPGLVSAEVTRRQQKFQWPPLTSGLDSSGASPGFCIYSLLCLPKSHPCASNPKSHSSGTSRLVLFMRSHCFSSYGRLLTNY